MDAFASALDHAAAISRGAYSSEELTRHFLDRIERLNPGLNHYVLVTAELAPRGERTILALAGELEAALPWSGRRPPGLA